MRIVIRSAHRAAQSVSTNAAVRSGCVATKSSGIGAQTRGGLPGRCRLRPGPRPCHPPRFPAGDPPHGESGPRHPCHRGSNQMWRANDDNRSRTAPPSALPTSCRPGNTSPIHQDVNRAVTDDLVAVGSIDRTGVLRDRRIPHTHQRTSMSSDSTSRLASPRIMPGRALQRGSYGVEMAMYRARRRIPRQADLGWQCRVHRLAVVDVEFDCWTSGPVDLDAHKNVVPAR